MGEIEMSRMLDRPPSPPVQTLPKRSRKNILEKHLIIIRRAEILNRTTEAKK
jgi:hypothetical protein